MPVASRQQELEELLRHIEDRTTRSIAAGRDVTVMGAFLAAIHPTADLVWFNFAMPVSKRADELCADDIGRLRSLFQLAGRRLRFEYFEALWPGLAAMLEEQGLTFEGRMPLMLCAPEDLRPVYAQGVEVCELAADAEDALIAEFLATGKRGFGLEAVEIEPQEIVEQRQHLETGVYRCAFGRVDGKMVGIGSVAQVNDELAGIATLPDYRRRGVAATVSSHLLANHFACGRTHAWLSAGDDVARAVYEKIGFRTAGVQLTYIDPA
jgi:ribosomal protein S18 acetylase RimI-like enzyme